MNIYDFALQIDDQDVCSFAVLRPAETVRGGIYYVDGVIDLTYYKDYNCQTVKVSIFNNALKNIDYVTVFGTVKVIKQKDVTPTFKFAKALVGSHAAITLTNSYSNLTYQICTDESNCSPAGASDFEDTTFSVSPAPDYLKLKSEVSSYTMPNCTLKSCTRNVIMYMNFDKEVYTNLYQEYYVIRPQMVRQMTTDVENLTFAYLYYVDKKPVFNLTKVEDPNYVYGGMIYYSKAEAIFYPEQDDADVRYPTRYLG